MTTYCCFLPDLTGFVGFYCAGPKRQHQFLEADHKIIVPRMGIQPRYSGLRVQGTATSPLSTALIIITIKKRKCNRRSWKEFGLITKNIAHLLNTKYFPWKWIRMLLLPLPLFSFHRCLN
jgi:hypothetical protein